MDENTKFIAINGFILVGVLSLLVFPDVIFGLFFQMLHLLLEFVHIIFEFIESTLDHVVEHLLHTELHETQVIVFYIIFSVASVGIYALWRTVPGYYGRARNQLIAFWFWEKSTTYLYWQGLTVSQKTKLVTVSAVSLYLLSFLVF